jgi:hypothetical protein
MNHAEYLVIPVADRLDSFYFYQCRRMWSEANGKNMFSASWIRGMYIGQRFFFGWFDRNHNRLQFFFY